MIALKRAQPARCRPRTNEVSPLSHSVVLCVVLVLGASPFCLACDKNGADAHEGADKTDAAQSDFEKGRDDYRRQKQADLGLLDKSITDLEAKRERCCRQGQD